MKLKTFLKSCHDNVAIQVLTEDMTSDDLGIAVYPYTHKEYANGYVKKELLDMEVMETEYEESDEVLDFAYRDWEKMIKLYSSHCPQCEVIEKILKNKNIDFEIIDNEDIYLDIAEKNGIASMPFADVDGNIINGKNLFNYIKETN